MGYYVIELRNTKKQTPMNILKCRIDPKILETDEVFSLGLLAKEKDGKVTKIILAVC